MGDVTQGFSPDSFRMSMEKRVYIETYGCQMNEHDSERMLRLLEGFQYAETKEANNADLILINTCSVREKPEHKVYSALGRFKKLKERRGTVIGVAGCVPDDWLVVLSSHSRHRTRRPLPGLSLCDRSGGGGALRRRRYPRVRVLPGIQSESTAGPVVDLDAWADWYVQR